MLSALIRIPIKLLYGNQPARLAGPGQHPCYGWTNRRQSATVIESVRRDIFRMILTALFLSVALPGAAELKVIELAIETRADAAVLPSGPLSALVVTPCTGCAPLSLPSSTRSRYFLGREQVSLDVLKQRLANRPTTMLLVTYRTDTRELTRIVANAQ